MQPAIPYLRTGDRVALAAPARAVSPEEMAPAIRTLQAWGLEVVVPDGLYERHNQLAGSDIHRAALLQGLLDDPSTKAILCARGGYGTVRIIDKLDFSRFALQPKWIVGYSDATVLHSHVQATLGLPTLHATMPINFPANGSPCPATESLRQALFGEPQAIVWDSHPMDRQGAAEGVATGGNLSILYSLLGSRSQIDTHGKILFIEDLDEYLYHIDRMMQALRRAGMLDGLAALVVGGLTDMHDNTTPWGHTAEEIVMEAVADKHYPVAFGAPIGHLGPANRALQLGTKLRLAVGNRNTISPITR
jgi:muramoyltetrapeptide carboxypeptidase